ncbi:gamma-glutamyltransferase [Sphingomonas sp. LY54]|uniref:gamma-glutamyltransferase n=1 Tax=Sphingomonas sp. LY54 TaxID=3095343 RepID=UPI002D797E14|nr:gamma-glutamyltransferase [Sphingomonas sp. LY54]WRP27434.1 gamma-glutamyltransferase [Sphingomonas sp. LY54]
MLKRFLLLVALIVAPVAATAQGVVSSADPRASAAGREILQAGGSAADAAMAMMLALTVVEPQSSGIGGGGFMIHHDASLGIIQTIDGREKAPAAAGPNRFIGADGKVMPYSKAQPGGFSVGVPGNIRLMARTHQRWGKLPWAQLFAPAIRLADEGFVVNGTLARRLVASQKLFERFPEARALFVKDGQLAKEGDTIRNPEMAKTLRAIAERGPDAFYSGEIGEAISAAVANAPSNPTQLTLADLAAYQAKDRAAVCTHYRKYKVCGMGPPSSGATTVGQILGMIERFDMKAMGKDDPRSWHAIAEAMKLAYADRDAYVGDADFVLVPVAGMIDPAYMRSRSKLISLARSLGKYEPGTPPGAAARTRGPADEVPGTTHFAAVDKDGNVANMTSTIEDAFGSQLVAGGFFLNNELTDFSMVPEKDGAPVANRVEPGKRPRSSMSPTIVYDESGQPVFAVGSAGGPRIIMHVLKSLVGYIDFGLSAQEAIALPNIFFTGDTTLVERGTFLEKMIPELSKIDGLVSASNLGSKLNAVERRTAGWRGAADPRSEGVALTE